MSPEFIGIAVTTLATILGAAYHLGMRRERVDNIKQGLTLEVRNLRDNNNQRFDRIELHLTSQDRQLSALQDRRAEGERWQGGVDTRLESHEGRIARLEQSEAA